MESKELRIDNYVKRHFWCYPPEGKIKEYLDCQVVSLGIEKVIVTSSITEKHLEKINYEIIHPIPLTEEWLFNFGFKKINLGRDMAHFYADTYNDWKIVERNGFYKRSGKTINYVHQLQNIYFALTEKELTL